MKIWGHLFDNKATTIKNDRLGAVTAHQQFKHFDLAYCITTHVSQGSTYHFPDIHTYWKIRKDLVGIRTKKETK